MYALCFTYHLPPEAYPLELPRAESWIRFDINWMRRREHLRWGPHAAYESLSWAARHLDEVDLSSWIWHCVWARRWGNMGLVNDTSHAAVDLACVADAYPPLVSLGSSFPAHVRTQSLAFRCSLRAELPADATVELLLRVALIVGVNSQWTRDALNAVVALYDDRLVHISDDVAMGLLDLAERQSCEQWETGYQIDVTDSRNPHFPFFQIARLLSRCSRLRARLLPAMCALGVPWLGVQSRDRVKPMARNLLVVVMDYYLELGYDRRKLRESPGVLLVARFASITTTIWPDILRWWRYRPQRETMLFALLSIWATRDETPEPDREPLSMDPPGQQGSTPEQVVKSGDDVLSTNAVRIAVHGTQGVMVETDMNSVADPFGGPTPAG